MSIWHNRPELTQLNQLGQNSLVAHLGIEATELGDDYLVGTMPVDHKTRQPFGLLHGGASVALAETLGSMAANLCVDSKLYHCVGLDINANHLRPVMAGSVRGIARPVHIGKTTQVWEIKIKNEQEQLCCISRLTLSVQKHQRDHNQ